MTLVLTSEQLQEVVDAYRDVDAWCFDVETVGKHRGDPRRNEVAWLSMATYGRTDVIPMGHPNGELLRLEYPILASGKASKDDRKATRVFSKPPRQLYPGEVFGALKPLFFGSARKIGQNTKFDICSVTKYLGEIPRGPFGDTMVLSYLLNSSHRPIKGYNKPYSLGAIVKRELDYAYDKSIGSDVTLHAFEEVRKYSHLDAKMTWLAHRRMSRRLGKAQLERLYKLEMEVLEVLCSMELEGAPIDEDTLVALDLQLAKEVRNALGSCYRAAGQAFNLNSHPQKIKVLYGPKSDGGQGLRPRKMTKGGQPACDDESLAFYAGKNPVVDALIEHSEVSKLHGTYIKAYLHGPVKSGKQLPPFAYSVNGAQKRIYADFVQTGAETGRFSCREPNLQNIPRPDTEKGKAIRGLFVATPGHSLVVADFSQIEPRVYASMSGDPAMMDAYLNDEGDFYAAIAAPFGLNRNAGKKMFLSIAYGIGPDKLAADAGIKVSLAKHVLEDFGKQFPAAGRFKEQVIEQCRRAKPPHVRTLMGRRRFLYEINSPSYGIKMRAERQAFNTVIQGSAADLNKIAMVRLHRALPADMKLLLTVHDEFVTLVPKDRADEGAEIVRQAMEGVNMLKVPLKADVKVVQRWADAK